MYMKTFYRKLLAHLSAIERLFTKLALSIFSWLLDCTLGSSVQIDANQPNKRPEMFAIKVLQFRSLPVQSKEYPEARSGHRLVADPDGNLYSFGGYNSDMMNAEELADDVNWQRTKPLFSELWKYNVSTNEWQRIQTFGKFPRQLASHSVALLDGELLISYGGTAVPFERCCSNDLHTCNLATDQTWSCLQPKNDDSTKSQLPSKRYGQALCLDERTGKIYVCGGTDGFSFCIDVHWSKIWTKLGSSIGVDVQARYRHEMTLFENKLYVFGGGTESLDKDCPLKTLPVFNLSTKAWTECETVGHREPGSTVVRFPAPRRCHIACRYKDFVFLIGGLSKRTVCGDLWKFDLRTKKWSLLISQIPMSVYFHAACVSRYGELSYFGGLTSVEPNSRTRKLFSVWIDIPPLKEMAWRALLFYGKLKNKSDAELAAFGLPAFFRQRLRND